MRIKLLKPTCIFLLILITSYTIEFPFHLNVAVAQTFSDLEESINRNPRVFSSLSFREGDFEIFGEEKEGVFFCSNPIRLENGRYEYYLIISNPKKKSISLRLRRHVGHGRLSPFYVAYSEPFVPEDDRVEIVEETEWLFMKYVVLRTKSQIVFRLLQSDDGGHLAVVQDGGEHIQIYGYGDCLVFIESVAIGMSMTLYKVLEASGYFDNMWILTQKLAFTVIPAIIQRSEELSSALEQLSPETTKELLIIRDAGFDIDFKLRTGEIPSKIRSRLIIKEVRKEDKPLIVSVGNLLRKGVSRSGDALLYTELYNFLMALQALKDEGGIVVAGPHELKFIISMKSIKEGGEQKVIDGGWGSKVNLRRYNSDINYQGYADICEGWVESLPLVRRSGNIIVAHDPAILTLAIERGWIDKPVGDIIGEIRLEKFLDALTSAIQKSKESGELPAILSKEVNFGDQKKKIGDIILESFVDDPIFRREKKVILVIGGPRGLAEHDGKVVYEGELGVIEVRYVGEGIKTLSLPGGSISPMVKQIDENGNIREMSSEESLQKSRRDLERAQKEVEGVKEIEEGVQKISKVKDQDEFLKLKDELKRAIGPLSSKVDDLMNNGKLRGDEAYYIQSLLADLEKYIDKGDFKLFSLSLEGLQRLVNRLKEGRFREFGRILVNLVKNHVSMKERAISFVFGGLKFIIPTQFSSNLNWDDIQNTVGNIIKICEDNKLFDNEYTEKLKKVLNEVIEAGRNGKKEEFIAKRYQLEVLISTKEKEISTGEARMLIEVEEILATYLQPTLEIIEQRINTNNVGSFHKLLLKLAHKILKFEEKISNIPQKFFGKVNTRFKIARAAGAMLAAVQLAEFLLPYMRDYFGDSPFLQTIQLTIFFLDIASFVTTAWVFSHLLISTILGVVTVAQLAKVLLITVIQPLIIAIVLAIVATLIYCLIIKPDSAMCLCNFSDARYALVERGVRPKESDIVRRLEASVSPGDTYDFYAFNVGGAGCDGVEYNFRLFDPAPYRVLIVGESCKMTCGREKCACKSTITIPSTIESQNTPLLTVAQLSPSVKSVEEALDPLRWVVTFVGTVIISPATTQYVVKMGIKCDELQRVCTLTYSNELEESFISLFYLIDPDSKKVLETDEKTIPSKAKGEIRTKQFSCLLGGKSYKVAIQIFKSSDIKFANPIQSLRNVGEVRC